MHSISNHKLYFLFSLGLLQRNNVKFVNHSNLKIEITALSIINVRLIKCIYIQGYKVKHFRNKKGLNQTFSAVCHDQGILVLHCSLFCSLKLGPVITQHQSILCYMYHLTLLSKSVFWSIVKGYIPISFKQYNFIQNWFKLFSLFLPSVCVKMKVPNVHVC